MKRAVLGMAGLLLWTGAATAEVVVELHDRPLIGSSIDVRVAIPPAGGVVDAATKANRPQSGQWFIPRFEADKLSEGDSTYFSIRSEAILPSAVVIDYFDVHANLQTTETIELESREVRSFALKYIPNLLIDGDGYARGFIRITALAPVTVDYFQLETRNAFAVGGVGFDIGDFCTRWNARFLRFGSSGGTTLSMMINGPQGIRPFDPVTVLGDIYSENGEFLASFSLRTNEWSLEIPIHDLVPAGVDFGVVELVVNAHFLPAGIIEVRHQALGQFSVGHWAICTD